MDTIRFLIWGSSSPSPSSCSSPLPLSTHQTVIEEDCPSSFAPPQPKTQPSTTKLDSPTKKKKEEEDEANSTSSSIPSSSSCSSSSSSSYSSPRTTVTMRRLTLDKRKCSCGLEPTSSLLVRSTTSSSSFSHLFLLPCLFYSLSFLLVIVPCAASYAASSFISPRLSSYDSWEHEAWLDDEGAFIVQWTPRKENIEFRVAARTRGYIGFGLSSSPRMDGADIVVGWVHSGKAYLQDRHGRGNQEPSVDDQRDWMLVGGYENDTHTVLIMSRPYNTCDKQDHPISNDTVRLLWAYHPDDPVDPESPRPRLHYHGTNRRGTRSMFLLERGHHTLSSDTLQYSASASSSSSTSSSSSSSSSVPSSSSSSSSSSSRTFSQLPSSSGYPSYASASASASSGHQHQHHHHHHQQQPTATKTWLLTNTGVEVAEGMDTVYWCKIFKRPTLKEKNHVIRYEPVFTPGNERYLHHIIVYECTDLDDERKVTFEEFANSEGHECYHNNMSKLMFTCNHVVVAWAVGSEGLTLPPEAGYPLTPKGPEFYMMEAHYDNPEGHTFRDMSGIRIIYTPALRNYDAGVLSIGLAPTWKHQIPPRQRTVLSEGHCVAECTDAALPRNGINVFAVILHTHLLGRKVRVRHLRDGRELEPIAQDNNYDFNYQEYRSLNTPRTVLPGDHLIGECIYNSCERSAITLGGFKTRDEMCLSFLFYWPRVDLSFCHSKPSLNTVLHSLGIQELSLDSNPIKIRRPIELAGKTLEWRLLNYDWKNQFEHFQEVTHTGTFNPMCWERGKSLISDLEKMDYEYPNITEPWEPENFCRRLRRKNRRRKTKNGRGRNHHLVLHDDDGEELEDEEGDEVMPGDQVNTNTRPIESIDVVPYSPPDLFMPVIEERVETDGFGIEQSNPGFSDQELEQEFQDMERDLEKEMAEKYPDTYPQRTATPNRSESGSGALRVTISFWLLLVFTTSCVLCICQFFDGHG